MLFVATTPWPNTLPSNRDFFFHQEGTVEIANCATCGMTLPAGVTRTPCPACGSTIRVAEESVLEVGHLTAFATGRSRMNLSVMHLLAAVQFSRATLEIETDHNGEEYGPFWESLFAHAAATVMMSAAGLEAYANEFFQDHLELFSGGGSGGTAVSWAKYQNKRPLEKYEFTLDRLAREPIDQATTVYQDTAALIKLRNALTHFKPEWEDERVAHAKVAADLQGRFENSRFFPAPQPLFPRAWVSHSCTSWAVRCVVAFIMEFDRRAGLGAGRLAPFAERLTDV